jgi:ADP-ribose pyrophosphatase YjhB (NUDIX family)
MQEIGVAVAVLLDGKLLLTQREDFEVWCLPGGAVEDREAIADAARREVLEETGLVVRLTHLVGLYSRPNWSQGGLHSVVFAAEPQGGSLNPNPEEVIRAEYFPPWKLPQPLLKNHLLMIEDIFSGGTGVVRTLDQHWPFEAGVDRQHIYTMREASGLSRQAFYLKHWVTDETDQTILETPPCGCTQHTNGRTNP